ncbi:hypothetical protein EJ06DRAFT_74363 [Trichodelitschia bisporula]|uniref:Uncharacterized protein n=1 Tax=Trichodelitschia bisporula TaxID=703511 RepID=A0A6G1HT43_9PEZI|nr:hypothetical protein EJ06DRAFT_74363 [Trichodelitschia bisporula]
MSNVDLPYKQRTTFFSFAFQHPTTTLPCHLTTSSLGPTSNKEQHERPFRYLSYHAIPLFPFTMSARNLASLIGHHLSASTVFSFLVSASSMASCGVVRADVGGRFCFRCTGNGRSNMVIQKCNVVWCIWHIVPRCRCPFLPRVYARGQVRACILHSGDG